jgi:hypothetical protein
MASPKRPFAEVLTSIFGNVQEIVRSEVRLAKAEVREDIAKASTGAAWVVTGAITGLFALGFALGAVFFALVLIVPPWTAALIIAVALALVSAIAFQVRAGKRKSITQRYASSSKTRHQENPAWAKQPIR